MTTARPARVYLTGDREGAYVVAEERADGSLVLTPDGRRAHASVNVPGPLSQLFQRRDDRLLTPNEALDAWGVDLLDDESVIEFAVAEVDERRGFVALTNRRFIFLAPGRSSLEPRQQHLLSEFTSVEPLRTRGKRGLVISWEGSEPTLIQSRDRDQIERLKARLLAR
jgi:hypothetical protein